MTTKPCIIIGSGGHARVVIDVLRLMDRSILFATTNDAQMVGKDVSGVPVKGDDTLIYPYGPDDVVLALSVGAPRSGDLRQKVWSAFDARGYRQMTIIHPSAVIAADTTLQDGVQIMAGAIIQPGCRVDEGAIINTGASIDHDCVIGPYAHIAPGATLCGNVRIGENTLVSAGTTLFPGETINRQADQS